MSKRVSLWMLVVLLWALAVPAGAQDALSPAVTVSDQVVLDGSVLVDSAVSDGPGWIVIHVDNGSGGPGPVIGHAALNAGANAGVRVSIDATQATPTLFAMLHTDTGEVGVYEFGTVEGADGPVRDASDNVITPPFNVDIIAASDQALGDDGTVTIGTVVAQADGFLVIHTDADGGPGPVAGFAPVSAGLNTDVAVTLDMNEPTLVLWPMLHVDTGTVGEYEFGTVQGADGPVRVNDRVAVTSISTVPHMRVSDQIVVPGDAMAVEGETPVVVARSVLAEQDGWLVIHTDADGGPGPVAGFAPVSAGLNENVEVTLDMNEPTLVLWPMLHVDTGEAGVYEFGTVEGADGPVRVNDQVLTFPINAAPIITYQGTLEGDTLTIAQAVIDAPGWLAIHSNNEGNPGPVIGHAPLRPGINSNVQVTVDAAAAGSQVFPMLHYDTGEAGVYEFGTVEGVDGPVRVRESVVVGPLQLEAAPEAADEQAASSDSAGDSTSDSASAACTVTGANANLRSGPGTNFSVTGTLATGSPLAATGQAQGADGFTWYVLDNGSWVRSDVVTAEGDCAGLPTADAPAAPAEQPAAPAEQPAAPAATEEAG